MRNTGVFCHRFRAEHLKIKIYNLQHAIWISGLFRSPLWLSSWLNELSSGALTPLWKIMQQSLIGTIQTGNLRWLTVQVPNKSKYSRWYHATSSARHVQSINLSVYHSKRKHQIDRRVGNLKIHMNNWTTLLSTSTYYRQSQFWMAKWQNSLFLWPFSRRKLLNDQRVLYTPYFNISCDLLECARSQFGAPPFP